MGRLDRLEIRNFKSYGGDHIIGPFRQFTSVIGPNGAGKSNVMDAISFVLGVRSGQLRGNQLRDLVYRREDDAPEENDRRAAVTAVYVDDDGMELKFTRTINPSGTGQSDYKLNGKIVSGDAYMSALKDIGILVKARNFLVFQGDVESIVNKSPKDLMAMIEIISGSAELSERYDQLNETKKEADDNAIFMHQKAKSIAQEKKQIKLQKIEAEKFKSLKDEEATIKAQQSLFQFYHIERSIVESRISEEEIKLNLKDIDDEYEKLSLDIKTHKQNQARITREERGIQKSIDIKEKKISETQPVHVKLKEQIEHTRKRKEKAEKDLALCKTELASQTSTLTKIQKDLKEVERAKVRFERDVEQGASSNLELSDEFISEYHDVQRTAQIATQRERQDLGDLERSLLKQQERFDSEKARVTELTARKNQLEAEKELLESGKDTLNKKVTDVKIGAEEAKAEASKLAVELHQAREKQEEMKTKLLECSSRLRDLKSVKEDSQREESMKDNIETLKRLFPCVKGQLTDLVKIVHRRYNVGVTVVMGRYMDAVVVEDEKTAVECIQYLKDHMLGRMTFIPMDVKSKPISDRLRMEAGSLNNRKLVIDVLTYDRSLERVLLFVCGSSIICENLQDARSLCFRSDSSSEERYKAVTLDGTLIHRSGNMTGGKSSIESRALKWNEREILELKKVRDAIKSELAALEPCRVLENRHHQKSASLGGIESILRTAKADLLVLHEKLDTNQKNLDATTRELVKHESAMNEAKAALDDQQASIDTLTKKINDIEVPIFASFSKKVGVNNIREFEENQLKHAKKIAAKRLEYDSTINRLKQGLLYEQDRDIQGAIDKCQTKITEEETSLVTLTDNLRDTNTLLKSLRTEFDKLLLDKERLQEEFRVAEGEVKELKKLQDTKSRDVETLRRQSIAIESKVEQLRNKRQNLWESSIVSEILVPTVNKSTKEKLVLLGGMDNDVDMTDAENAGCSRVITGRTPQEVYNIVCSELFPSIARANPKATVDQDGDVDMGEQLASLRSSMGGNPDDMICISFDSLSRSDRNLSDAAEIETAARKFTERLALITAELEKIDPNMRAIDRFEDVKRRLGEAEIDEANARKKQEVASKQFESVKKERKYRLEKAFNHVAERIDTIYKELTKSAISNLGGQAFLSLENTDEPYLGGIKYNAMPPSKRFREMDQLSGGEKSVAALALLFAIHSYHPSPFFVLDEVDAALDVVNVNQVANYIRSHKNDFQSIVMSLKDNFYEKADALVGIARDHMTAASRAYTLDLENYVEA